MDTRALLSLVLVVSAVASASACSIESTKSTLAIKAANELAAGAFTDQATKAHVDAQPEVVFLDNTRTTLSCVDARGSAEVEGTLGTPGGDLAELQGAIVAYCRVK